MKKLTNNGMVTQSPIIAANGVAILSGLILSLFAKMVMPNIIAENKNDVDEHVNNAAKYKTDKFWIVI